MSLPSSMADVVPCDHLLEKAYSLTECDAPTGIHYLAWTDICQAGI